jgi:hypothetical protein
MVKAKKKKKNICDCFNTPNDFHPDGGSRARLRNRNR